jgi:predicted Zn-dependent protease
MSRILIILPALLLFASVQAQHLNKNTLRVNALLEQRKYSEALPLVIQNLKSNQKNIKLAGDCFYCKSLINKALSYYLKYDSIAPGSCNLEIAKCFSMLNQPASSLLWLRKYLSAKNKIPEYQLVTDTAFKLVSKTDEWKTLMKANWYSESEQEYNAINASIKNNNFKSAQEQLEAKQGILSKEEYNYLEALAYKGLNMNSQALYYISMAIEFNSRNENYFWIKAEIELDSKKYEDSYASISKSININPNLPKYYLLRGKAAYLAGYTAQSDTDLTTYLQLFPESDEGNFYKGNIESQKGNYRTAMGYLEKALITKPTNPEYLISYGEAAYNSSEYSLAEENTSMALDLTPNDPKANLIKGRIRLYFEDTQSACIYLQKAINSGNKEALNLYETNCRK